MQIKTHEEDSLGGSGDFNANVWESVPALGENLRSNERMYLDSVLLHPPYMKMPPKRPTSSPPT